MVGSKLPPVSIGRKRMDKAHEARPNSIVPGWVVVNEGSGKVDCELTTEGDSDAKEPYMQGLGCSNDLCPAELILLIVLHHRTSMFQDRDDVFSFFLH